MNFDCSAHFLVLLNLDVECSRVQKDLKSLYDLIFISFEIQNVKN